MRNTIPCKSTLANTHIKVSGQCLDCENGAENIKDILIQFSRAKLVCRNLSVDLKIDEACQIESYTGISFMSRVHRKYKTT
jgi:hypothetical protein